MAKVINTVGTLTDPWYGDGLVPDMSAAKKWRDPNLTGAIIKMENQTLFGDQNQILIRYAEIILDRAECKIRTGDVAGGYG